MGNVQNLKTGLLTKLQVISNTVCTEVEKDLDSCVSFAQICKENS